MAIGELSDNATHEEIHDYVSQLVAEQSAEQKASEAESSTAPADDTTSKETPAGDETPASGDTAATDKGGEGQAKSDSAERTWLDDDTKGLASAYGISDQELSGCQSKEQLDWALGLLDQRAMAAGKEILASNQTASPDQKQQTQEQQTPQADQRQLPARGTDGKWLPKPSQQQATNEEPSYKVQLNPEDLDSESVVKEFNGLRDHYEGRIQALNSEIRSIGERFARLEKVEQQRIAQAHLEAFDAVVDSLGQVELFGETMKETPAQMENRRKLFAAHHTHLAGLKAMGRQGRTDKAFLDRAARAEFPDHFTKQLRKSLTAKVSEQSKMIMGSGGSKPTPTKPSVMDKMEALYAKLEKGG